MIDAYTIGITLALNDGVSAGIAAIRQELVVLDQVVTSSAAGLVDLTKVAATLHVPSPDLRMPNAAAMVSRAARPAQSITDGHDETTAPLANTAAPLALAPPVAQQRPAEQSIAPTSLQSSPSSAQSADTGISERSTWPVRQAHATDQSWPRPATRAPAVGSANPVMPTPPPLPSAVPTPVANRSKQLIPSTAVAPIVPTAPAEALAPKATPAARPAASVQIMLPALNNYTVSPLVVAAATTTQSQVRSAAPLPPEPATSQSVVVAQADFPGVARAVPRYGPPQPPKSPFIASPKPAIAPPVQHPAQRHVPHWTSVSPVSKAQATPAVSIVPRANTLVPRLSSTSPQQEAALPAREPQEGIIILDGARLGRWIVDHLVRQAARPSSGITGIDPRISATFPGAPNGL